jgi:hypothetical protein
LLNTSLYGYCLNYILQWWPSSGFPIIQHKYIIFLYLYLFKFWKSESNVASVIMDLHIIPIQRGFLAHLNQRVMWSCVVITLLLPSLVNLSHFDLDLNHLANWDQTMWEWSLDGSLHSLLFIWSYPKSNMASTTETRGFMPRRVFCMWSIYFDDFFFVFLVKFATLFSYTVWVQNKCICMLFMRIEGFNWKGKILGVGPIFFTLISWQW